MGPFPGNWLAARIPDLTPDLQVLLSWGSTVVSFHSRQSFSVSFFHVCLGLPAPCLPSICISYAVLIAPLERATCPNQRSLLSLKMRSRSSSWSFASSSLDLTLATSSGLILQICLIMALSLRCKRCRFVLVSGQVSLAWSMVLRTQELYTWPQILWERWRDVRTGSSSLNFFQACIMPYREKGQYLQCVDALCPINHQWIPTRLRSTVGNESGCRYVSDCRSRGWEFSPARSLTFLENDHEIISAVCQYPPFGWFKKGCQLQAKVCGWSTG